MTYHVRPALLTDIPDIVKDLVPAGLEDISRTNSHPVLRILVDTFESDTYLIYTDDNKPVVLAGFQDGFLWMHMTNEIFKNPISFVKFIKRWLKSMSNQYPLMTSFIDIHNTALLKLAKHVGFKSINLVPDGTPSTYYVESVRLWPF